MNVHVDSTSQRRTVSSNSCLLQPLNLRGQSHCGLLPTVKALPTQCLLETAKLHLQKVPVLLSSSDSSQDGETEEPKEKASSIHQKKQNFR